MRNKVMKPMSVARSEFIQSLTNLINESTLPLFVIESILKDMYSDVRSLSQRQLEIDLKNYREALSQAEDEDTAE
jgi:hypothetical protein